LRHQDNQPNGLPLVTTFSSHFNAGPVGGRLRRPSRPAAIASQPELASIRFGGAQSILA
jgi:hypothetical protein